MVEVVQVAPPKECTCWNCKSKLKYVFADIKSEYARDYIDGGGDTYYRITCPVCNKDVTVGKW